MSKLPTQNELRLALFLALALAFVSTATATEKITLEELLARHLESIGPEKVRAGKRIIAGRSLVIFHTEPKGQATGRAVLASEGIKNLLGMSFPSPVYPREQFGYNGNSFMAAFVTPGVRSSLGSFLMTHSLIFKQGLMGGTLSSAWPLLDLATRGARLEYAGQKRVEKRSLHEIKYSPRGGSDLQINLFFDPDTYRHVRTEYLRVVSAPTGSRSATGMEERETRYKMVEEFSDFKKESELSLPHTYEIRLTVDSQGGTFAADWVLTLTQFTFNEKIDPASFSISGD